MSYPSPYGGQYPDIYGTESPSTPHPQQPPGAFPQWETVEHTQIHDLHSLQSSHHSTPMQTPTSTSFRPIELEEPPRFVPSQAHLSHSPMEGSAPVLLHHPHAVQQQQFQQHQYDYLSQHQQQMHQQTGYEQMQEMGPPDSSALFRTPQQPMGVLRSIPSSRGRAVASHPYDRRTSGGSLSSQRGHDSPGESVESRATPVAVSPVPSSSGSGVTITPVPYVAPAPALPSPPTRATTRRTRSSTKPKASVRFEAGTKATSGPAPTSRAAAARAGTPVPSTSTNTGSTSTVPLLRSATRKATFSARTPPPSQTIATSIAAASDSGSGSRTTPSNARSVPQPSSSLSTSAPSTSAPSTSTHDPSTIPHAPPSVALETRIRSSSSYPRGLITAIATDMQYSPENHTLTASLELPGVKRENLQVKLETCYYNRVKYLVVLALSIPVFDSDRSEKAAGEQRSVVSEGRGHPSTSAPGTLDVHMRREEEEEEEDGDSSMKTEVPETTAPVPPPTRMATRHRSPSATPTAPSPLSMPPSTFIPPTSASEQNLSSSPYGMVKPPPPSSSDTAGSTIRITREAMRKLLDPTLRERRFGIKRRIIQVPSTTTLANIKASLEDGVLTLQIDCGPPYEIDDQIDIPVR